jgi:hypothetical protein
MNTGPLLRLLFDRCIMAGVQVEMSESKDVE